MADEGANAGSDEGVDEAMLALMKENITTLETSDDEDAVKEAFDKITEPCTDPKIFDKALDAILLVDNACNIILDTVKKWHAKDTYGNVVSQGMSTLHNTSLLADIALQYLAAGGWEVIIDCMNTYPDHYNLQIRGCGAIGNMVANNDNRELMTTRVRTLEVSNVVTRAMTKHPDNPKLHRWAFKALDRMTELNELNEYYMETGLLSELAISFDRIRRLGPNEFTADIHKFAWSAIMHLHQG